MLLYTHNLRERQGNTPSPNFAEADVYSVLDGFSHPAAAIAAVTETDASVWHGLAIATATALADASNNGNFSSILITDSAGQSQGEPSVVLAQSEANVVAAFSVEAGAVFSFDFLENLELFSKEINRSAPEFAQAQSATGFILVEINGANEVEVLAQFGAAGALISSNKIAEYMVDYGASPGMGEITYSQDPTTINIGGNDGFDSVLGSVSAHYSHSFVELTQLAIIHYNYSAILLADRIGTVSFAVVSDRGAAMADGVVDFGSETLKRSPHIEHQELVAIFGDGDRRPEAGETGYKLSDMGYGGRVTSLDVQNDDADPVLVTAHGRIDNTKWGDLTGKVRFSNDGGFGLDNGPDGERAARFLNGGDSLTFDVGSSGKLGKLTFTANTAGCRTADIKLAADGDILTSGLRSAGGGLDDFALDLGFVKGGTKVCIDLMAREITYTAANGRHVLLDEVAVQPLLDEFIMVGADQITLGSRSGDGFALLDLQLEVWTDFLVA